MYYVYVLLSASHHKTYTGITDNIKKGKVFKIGCRKEADQRKAV